MLVGLDPARPVDAIFINSPLKDYDLSPRYNDFTLPVLGLGYIATYAHAQGLNVGVLDAEAAGLGLSKVASLVNGAKPRWVGLNLLAPTYRYSVEILRRLDPDIAIMLGGHQAKAMPLQILNDVRIPRVDALILGEGEYRAAALLTGTHKRDDLPGVWWRDSGSAVRQGGTSTSAGAAHWLAPDIDALPFVERGFLAQDPFTTPDGTIEANLVGSRGCPYDCAFCGAAISANPDISIRTRSPGNIIAEMEHLSAAYGVTAFRFVDDLFLASPPFMRRCLEAFERHGIGERFVWDATGRINVLSRVPVALLDLMRRSGCREVALGIESGNPRVLQYMGKRITPDMTRKVVRALTERGISVKGYFILGYPTETREEMDDTIRLIHDLWKVADEQVGTFRCSAFEFRPYPGTPEWARLMASGRYTESDMLMYEHVDLTGNGHVREMLERDEFNFSVNMQFGDVPVQEVRSRLTDITVAQKQRMSLDADHVQRTRYD